MPVFSQEERRKTGKEIYVIYKSEFNTWEKKSKPGKERFEVIFRNEFDEEII